MATRQGAAAGRVKPGQYACEGLERVMHERARLGILSALAGESAGLPFGDLKRGCGLTDGNLSRHLDALRGAGLIEIWKGFEGRRPHTICRITPDGRRRFAAYLSALDGVVRTARKRSASRAERPPALPPGFQRT